MPRPPYNPEMANTPLAYEAATAFHRVRSERRVHGLAVAVFLGIMTCFVLFARLAGRGGWMVRLFMGGLLVLVAYFLVREGWAMLRSRSAWEVRIAGDRLYLRLAGDPSEQSVGLGDVRHVMVAKYGTANNRYSKVFLLLCDSRCWEIPAELLFPRRALFRAIRRAAPHVTVVTNAQMPERDPLNEPPRAAAATPPSGVEQAAFHCAAEGARPASPARLGPTYVKPPPPSRPVRA